MRLVGFYYKNLSDVSCALFGVSHSSYEERDIAVRPRQMNAHYISLELCAYLCRYL
jgi:hypothetical protein